LLPNVDENKIPSKSHGLNEPGGKVGR
jgi:hypothetical protein